MRFMPGETLLGRLIAICVSAITATPKARGGGAMNRDRHTTLRLLRGRYFNPHTREGCDSRLTCAYRQTIGISIHTPVKGVTYLPCLNGHGPIISIHTPVKGVTRPARAGCHARSHFNPHTREGCDVPGAGGREVPGGISIHTPVKGVTTRARATYTPISAFQSTHP